MSEEEQGKGKVGTKEAHSFLLRTPWQQHLPGLSLLVSVFRKQDSLWSGKKHAMDTARGLR